MAERSVFADEWRACLREQYISVVQNDDQVTLRTLVSVMYEVGFDEAELRELYLQATMRAEDVADDFVPDMDIFVRPEPAEMPPEPEQEQALESELETASEPDAALEPEPDDEAELPDDSAPQLPPDVQQLTLF